MPRRKTAKKDFVEQKRTLEETRRLLAKYHKCIVIRPTGFGKTWLLTELIQDYKKVLYLYPSAVVADTVVDRYYDIQLEKAENEALDPETVETYNALHDENKIDNCDLMTYAALIRKGDDELKALARKYDLVICDEAHRLGGPKTKIAMEKLFAYARKKTHFVGATATPTRMDNFDVTSHFYGDRMTYIYTLYDAIEAKLIMRPNYCYATYDFRKDLEDAFEADGQNIKDKDVKAVIDAKAIEISKLYNMPSIIREVCDKYALNTSYMKFIVFFASKNHMNEKLDDVVSWFKDAYPDHNVATLKISSRSKEEQRNTDKLPLLSPKANHIDLIACIDMLNVGYHVSNQTGILMYRGTKSNTIFTQQLGRALSVGANSSAIVFDIVDNLHRKAVYELYAKDPSKPRTKTKTCKPMHDDYELDKDTGAIIGRDSDGNPVMTQYRLDEEGNIVDRYGNKSTFEYDPDTDEIINNADANSESRNINNVTPQCLNATGHEAKYRDIIAKAMAEPLTQRCKYALQLHFRSWCLAHNIPYPISDEELAEIYDRDISEFYDEFKKIVKMNKIEYPLGDAKKLLAIGSDPNSIDVPLSICCDARGVSIDQMTELIFGNDIQGNNKRGRKRKEQNA